MTPEKDAPMRPHCFLILVTFAWSLMLACEGQAALAPEEIAIVVSQGAEKSMELARHYCLKRGVPDGHVIPTPLPASEVMEREEWRDKVRPAIREWLQANDPEGKLRCLVTTWGTPLKINRAKPNEKLNGYLEYLEGERAARLKAIDQLTNTLDRLAGGSPLSSITEALPSDDDPIEKGETELAAARRRLNEASQAARARLGGLSGAEEQRAKAQLQQWAVAAAGSRLLLQGMNQQIQALANSGRSSEPLRRQFELLRGRASAFSEIKLSLDQQAPGYKRDSLTLDLMQKQGGLIAAVEWLDAQLAIAHKNESEAAFDSELSLVLWPDDYELLRWQPNYLHHGHQSHFIPKAFRALMVARIDGPTFPLAKGLIDQAIEVEEQGGLTGKTYIDARGLTKIEQAGHSPGSYADFDRSLLLTAQGLKSLRNGEGDNRFDVVLDKQPELYQAGQCPDAALYCGWYSLANYVDAFEWRPGAVAYHLASAEASTLKRQGSQVWCKRMLEEGVIATMGPVFEPYLMAFPRPNEFFPLLARGDMTLVEVYYHTKPFNSWAMTLIGDPLYRPIMPGETTVRP